MVLFLSGPKLPSIPENSNVTIDQQVILRSETLNYLGMVFDCTVNCLGKITLKQF